MRAFVFVSAVVVTAVLTLVPTYAITNGVPDGDRHPYVGLLVFDDEIGPWQRCTGSLLSPTVVLTAGHCTENMIAARVWFQSSVEGNTEYPYSGVTSYDGVAHTYPGMCFGCGAPAATSATGDIGVVVLSEPVPTSAVSRYVQLPEQGRADLLRNKARIDFVGFGVQFQVRGGGVNPFDAWQGTLVRMFAPTEVVSGKFVRSDELLRLAMNASRGTGGMCFGDSGGPDLAGGTDVVLGVNSFVANVNCTGHGYSSRVDTPAALAWISSFLNRP